MSDDQKLHKNQQNSQADSDQLQYSKNQEGATSSSLAQYPVSGPQKEHAPIETSVAEYIKPTQEEPLLQPEVKEVGVEVSPNLEHPSLTEEHQSLGIEYAKESVPVAFPKKSSIQLPHTLEQTAMLKKTTNKDDSKHWLLTLAEYLLKKLAFNSTQTANQQRRE